MTSQGRWPIIILGCPRSGTTVLAKMLQELGVFMGSTFDMLPNGEETRESSFITSINSWIMEVGAGPPGLMELCSNPRKRKLIAQYVELLFASPNIQAYLGEELYQKFGSPLNMDKPWGWKDPVSTYTLPIWLELFPGAKVIHIYRNGVAVAHSIRKLHRASEGTFQKFVAEQAKKQGKEKIDFPPDKSYFLFLNFPDSSPVKNSLAFWENMTMEADRQISILPLERKTSVRFESLIDNGAQVLQGLAEFLGLNVDQEKIKAVSAILKADRRDAFRSDPEFAKIYEAFKRSPQMVRYSYSS